MSNADDTTLYSYDATVSYVYVLELQCNSSFLKMDENFGDCVNNSAFPEIWKFIKRRVDEYNQTLKNWKPLMLSFGFD